MDEESLLKSDGTWHRGQRKRITFQDACYYTHEKNLPYGCQYSMSERDEWALDPQRSQERTALTSIYEATGGSGWRSAENWNEGDPCWDYWYGVTCDEHGHVIALELSDNRLTGSLPSSLGLLTAMLKIDFSSTAEHYHGHENYNVNRLRGPIPSLKNLKRLEEIEVSGNAFDAFPEDFYRLAPTLRVLSGSRNRFSALPRLLRRFRKLHTLELGNNQLRGALPNDLGQLESMRYLQLEYNLFEGAVPQSITGMRMLRTFDISHNPGITGEVPADVVVTWPTSEYISVINTSVTGYIAALCLDVPFCWRFMYDTHADMSMVERSQVPDIVWRTIDIATTPP